MRPSLHPSLSLILSGKYPPRAPVRDMHLGVPVPGSDSHVPESARSGHADESDRKRDSRVSQKLPDRDPDVLLPLFHHSDKHPHRQVLCDHRHRDP